MEKYLAYLEKDAGTKARPLPSSRSEPFTSNQLSPPEPAFTASPERLQQGVSVEAKPALSSSSHVHSEAAAVKSSFTALKSQAAKPSKHVRFSPTDAMKDLTTELTLTSKSKVPGIACNPKGLQSSVDSLHGYSVTPLQKTGQENKAVSTNQPVKTFAKTMPSNLRSLTHHRVKLDMNPVKAALDCMQKSRASSSQSSSISDTEEVNTTSFQSILERGKEDKSDASAFTSTVGQGATHDVCGHLQDRITFN